MEYDGELRLALRRIAEIRLELEESADTNNLARLADKVRISYDACQHAYERTQADLLERMMLDE
jgi:hypothetical protein